MLFLAAGCQRPQPNEAALPFAKAIEKQRKLPRAEVTALQDLRLMGAVQTTHFSSKQRYATADELKAAGFLDPAWPRSAPSAYKLEIQLGEEGAGFEVFADPVEKGLGHYRIDETQVVRTERERRPTAASTVF